MEGEQNDVNNSLKSLLSSIISSQPEIDQIQYIYDKIKINPYTYLKQMQQILLCENISTVKNIIVSMFSYISRGFLKNQYQESEQQSQNRGFNINYFVRKLEGLINSDLQCQNKRILMNNYYELVKKSGNYEQDKMYKKLVYLFQSKNQISGICLAEKIIEQENQYAYRKFIKFIAPQILEYVYKILVIAKDRIKYNQINFCLQIALKSIQQLFPDDEVLNKIISQNYIIRIFQQLIERQRISQFRYPQSNVASMIAIFSELIKKFRNNRQQNINSVIQTISSKIIHLNCQCINNECYMGQQILFSSLIFLNYAVLIIPSLLAYLLQNISNQNFLLLILPICFKIIKNRILQFLQNQEQPFQILNYLCDLSIANNQINQSAIAIFMHNLCSNHPQTKNSLFQLVSTILSQKNTKFVNTLCNTQTISTIHHQSLSHISQYRQNIYLLIILAYRTFRNDQHYLNMFHEIITQQLRSFVSPSDCLFIICLLYQYFEQFQHLPHQELSTNLVKNIKYHMSIIDKYQKAVQITLLYQLRVLQKFIDNSYRMFNSNLYNQKKYIDKWMTSFINLFQTLQQLLKHVSVMIKCSQYSILYDFIINVRKISIKWIPRYSTFAYENPHLVVNSLDHNPQFQIRLILSQLYQLIHNSANNSFRRTWLILQIFQDIACDYQLQSLYKDMVLWIEHPSSGILVPYYNETLIKSGFQDSIIYLLIQFGQKTKHGCQFFNQSQLHNLMLSLLKTMIKSIKQNEANLPNNMFHLLFITAVYSKSSSLINLTVYFLTQFLLSQAHRTNSTILYAYIIVHTVIYNHHDKLYQQTMRNLIKFCTQNLSEKSQVIGMQKIILLMFVNYEFDKFCYIISNQLGKILDLIFIDEADYNVLYDSPVFVTQTLQIISKMKNTNNRVNPQIVKRTHFMIGAVIINLDRIYQAYTYKQGHQYFCHQLFQYISNSQSLLHEDEQIRIKFFKQVFDKYQTGIPYFMQKDQFESFRQIFSQKNQQILQWIHGIIHNYLIKLHAGSLSKLLKVKKIIANSLLDTKYRIISHPIKNLNI